MSDARSVRTAATLPVDILDQASVYGPLEIFAKTNCPITISIPSLLIALLSVCKYLRFNHGQRSKWPSIHGNGGYACGAAGTVWGEPAGKTLEPSAAGYQRN